jgi:hypothetical protein
MKSMAHVIQADENGALIVPPGAAGLIEPARDSQSNRTEIQ